MFYEAIRVIIQKLFQDKILLGLAIILVLLLFTGSFHTEKKDEISTPPPSPAPKQSTESKDSPIELSPETAVGFLKQVLGRAFDYSPKTAAQSHDEAFQWMTPEARHAFCATFWNHELMDQLSTGNLKVSYTPTSIQADAINPDGSVVVSVLGKMISEENGSQSTQMLKTAFLINRIEKNFRIAGVYNTIASPSVP